MNPFISPEMSLPEQLKSLSMYGHLSAAMWRHHGPESVTGALYHDSQAILKNIYFTVGRLRLIDPSLPFHIILEGTDRLEQVFSECRTQDHARNFDIDQLSQKLSTGAMIAALFERYPELDRGHRRLNLKDALGIDHINPKSWNGDVRVGGFDIQHPWDAGCEAANALIPNSHATVRIDPAIFADRSLDLLRPVDTKTYVGVRRTKHDERSEAEDGDEGEGGVDGGNDDDDLPEVEEPALADLGLELEDFLPPTPEEEAVNEPRKVDKKLVTPEGQSFYKSSLVAALNPDRAKKVSVRTLRARGVALEDLTKPSVGLGEPIASRDLDREALLKSGDLVGCLARRPNEHLCLSVLQVTAFRHGKRLLPSLPAKDTSTLASDVVAVCQLLEMRRADVDGIPKWQWTGSFLPNSDDTSTTARKKDFLIEVPISFLQVLSPEAVKSVTADGNPCATWSVAETDLDGALVRAYQSLRPDEAEAIENVKKVPQLVTTSLPYRDSAGMFSRYTVQTIADPANRNIVHGCSWCSAASTSGEGHYSP